MVWRPNKGTCTGKGRYVGCRNEGLILTNSRRLCQTCERKRKPPKPICKRAEKKEKEIKDSNKYYLDRIIDNIKRNLGTCRCDNCTDKINDPLLAKGSIVCHIISFGANASLYLDSENSWILGRGPLFKECNCKWVFDESGKRESMKIFAETEARKVRLKAKYYSI